MPARREHRYYVYIMSSQTRVLYIGVTNDLERRVQQHKDGVGSNVWAALQRERELKGWIRARMVELIEFDNPDWLGLSESWTDTGT